MVRKSFNSSRRRDDLGARVAAGQLSDAEIRDLTSVIRDALRQVGSQLRNAHGGEGGTERRCCREGTCEESKGLAEWAASRGTGPGHGGQAPGQRAKHGRLTREGAQVLNRAFQRAEDNLEDAPPPEFRRIYRDMHRNGRIG